MFDSASSNRSAGKATEPGAAVATLTMLVTDVNPGVLEPFTVEERDRAILGNAGAKRPFGRSDNEIVAFLVNNVTVTLLQAGDPVAFLVDREGVRVVTVEGGDADVAIFRTLGQLGFQIRTRRAFANRAP